MINSYKTNKILKIATDKIYSVHNVNKLLFIDSDKNLEYEAKVDIVEYADLIETLSIIKSLKILKFEYRSEIHHLFEIGNKSIACLVFIEKYLQTWIKIKSETKKIKSKNLKLPFLIRKGVKFKPGDSGYNKALNKSMSGEYFFSYNKECINYFFKYNNSIYSLSLSLANGKNEFSHYQMEFEYEGYLKGTKKPNKKEILIEFENLFSNFFPYLINKFNTETKYEALKKLI